MAKSTLRFGMQKKTTSKKGGLPGVESVKRHGWASYTDVDLNKKGSKKKGKKKKVY